MVDTQTEVTAMRALDGLSEYCAIYDAAHDAVRAIGGILTSFGTTQAIVTVGYDLTPVYAEVHHTAFYRRTADGLVLGNIYDNLII